MKHKIGVLILLTLALAATIVFLWKMSLLAALAALIISTITLTLFYEKRYVKLYIIVAIIGTLIEYVLVSLGVWTHASQGIAGVPYWIPFVWGYTGLASTLFADWLKNGK